MLKITDITAIKLEIDEQTKKYVAKRFGGLEKFLPRHARKSAHAEVKIKQIDKSHGNKYEVELLLHVPDKLLAAHDTGSNVLATVDVVEAKMLSQLQKYKTNSLPHMGRRGVMARFKRSFARES